MRYVNAAFCNNKVHTTFNCCDNKVNITLSELWMFEHLKNVQTLVKDTFKNACSNKNYRTFIIMGQGAHFNDVGYTHYLLPLINTFRRELKKQPECLVTLIWHNQFDNHLKSAHMIAENNFYLENALNSFDIPVIDSWLMSLTRDDLKTADDIHYNGYMQVAKAQVLFNLILNTN